MAYERVPDAWELVDELEQLVREERDLSSARERLHERIDRGFKTELTVARERQISDARRALHARIDALRAQLKLVDWEPGLPFGERRRLHELGLLFAPAREERHG